MTKQNHKELYQFIIQEGMPPRVRYYSVSPPVYVRNAEGKLIPATRDQTKSAAKCFLKQQGKEVNFAKMVHVRKFDTRFNYA